MTFSEKISCSFLLAFSVMLSPSLKESFNSSLMSEDTLFVYLGGRGRTGCIENSHRKNFKQHEKNENSTNFDDLVDTVLQVKKCFKNDEISILSDSEVPTSSGKFQIRCGAPNHFC